MEEKSRAVRSVESEETFNDYEFSPVPDEKKNTWKAQVFVWLGVGFCLTAFTLGGQIALGLGFWPTVAAVLVGGIILTVVGALVGAIGVRSGLSSTVSSRFTFGTYGAIIFGLINCSISRAFYGERQYLKSLRSSADHLLQKTHSKKRITDRPLQVHVYYRKQKMKPDFERTLEGS